MTIAACLDNGHIEVLPSGEVLIKIRGRRGCDQTPDGADVRLSEADVKRVRQFLNQLPHDKQLSLPLVGAGANA